MNLKDLISCQKKEKHNILVVNVSHYYINKIQSDSRPNVVLKRVIRLCIWLLKIVFMAAVAF